MRAAKGQAVERLGHLRDQRLANKRPAQPRHIGHKRNAQRNAGQCRIQIAFGRVAQHQAHPVPAKHRAEAQHRLQFTHRMRAAA